MIKSRFINQKIFIHLYDAKLLKLIKYNKTLQKKLNISLYNYKLFTGKYIEYDRNGKGKEYYFNGKLYFEGEYLNGKKNGKGKEYYDNGKLEYEGEYLNGKRNGIGKEYNYYDELVFEGEYLNGKRWNGKGYDKNDNIIYELEK